MAERGTVSPDAPPGADRSASLLAQIERTLAGSQPRHALEEVLVPGQTLERSRELHRYFPPEPAAAAVLIPLVAHPREPTVLLTRRSRALRNHAGQVSFPGGRIEAEDGGPVGAALREAREEIGLESRFISVIGFLPDHVVITGFRVTPVVARVMPGFALRIGREEVDDAFEVPLSFVFDSRNYRPRLHRLRGTQVEVEMVDIPYGEHNIWGATAGMLMTLRRMCLAGAGDV